MWILRSPNPSAREYGTNIMAALWLNVDSDWGDIDAAVETVGLEYEEGNH